MFFTREVRPGRSDRTGLFAAWQSRLQVDPRFEPGAAIYYHVGDIGRPGRLADQGLLTGPMDHDAYALRHFGLRGAIKYEAGHLFGARRDSPRGRCAGASSTTSHSENPARIYRRLIFEQLRSEPDGKRADRPQPNALSPTSVLHSKVEQVLRPTYYTGDNNLTTMG